MKYKLVFLILVLVSLAVQADSKSPHILLLHSYHEEFVWSKTINDEVKGNLQDHWTDCSFSVEYLDTKRFNAAEMFALAADQFAVKYARNTPDAIVCSDNNALLFLKEYRDRLFPGVPVFFCGVNDFSSSLIKGMAPVSGIVEYVDLAGSIDMIQSLIPQLEKLVLVSDHTTTSEALLKEFQVISKNYRDVLEIINYQGVYKPELTALLETHGKESAVLFLSYYRASPERYLSVEEAVSIVSLHTEAPVFVLWDFCIGTGAVGGLVTSAVNQANAVSPMVLDYLERGTMEGIEVQTLSPNQYIFDYEVLSRFPLNFWDLPADIVYINKPVTLFQEHRGIMLTLFISFMLLLIFILILIVDINRRRELERTLRIRQRMLSDILDHIPLIVYWKNKKGKMLGFNRGLTLDRSAEWEFSEEGKVRLQYWENLQKDKDSPLIFQEDSWKDETGKLRYYLLTIVPVKEKDSPLGLLTLIQDISEQKGMEHQWKQSQKMEALGRMAGGMAHDFNNMLTAITTAADLIEQTSTSEEIQDYAGMILETSDQAHGLVNALLDYARKKPIEMKALQVKELIEGTIKILQRTISKKVQVEYIENKPDLSILCDSSVLRSALLNLGINASDAMKGEGALHFRTDTIFLTQNNPLNLAEGDYLELRVEDTGEGIPEEALDKLFDPFYTTKQRGKGTGLGLAGVYSALRSHHGAVKVESTPNMGSTFILYIPLSVPNDL